MTGVLIPLQTDGPIGSFLAAQNVPFAGMIGDALAFLIAFLVVYVLGTVVLLPIFDRVMDARGLDAHAKRPLRKLTWFVIVFLGVTVAFGFAGFENFLQSLATIAAAATLAIGFAMQDVIRNFVAGVFIFTDRPFRIGDWIEWDGHSGIVEDISLRVTRVRTFDNELLTVPNGDLSDGVIKNPVANDRLRLRVPFGIGYDDDVPRAMEIIHATAADHPDILTEPEPTVRLTELGDSAVVLQSRIWIADPSRSDFTRIRGEYVADVKERFDAEGIEFPFPQRDLSGTVELADGAALEG